MTQATQPIGPQHQRVIEDLRQKSSHGFGWVGEIMSWMTGTR